MEAKIKGFIEVNVKSSGEIKVLVNVSNIADVTSMGGNNAIISTNAGSESHIKTKESYSEIISLIKEATEI
ncbi:hypothetical protein [Chryseobacterium sediminis]|uniref:Uncharacterized protein n=1 Tax=Chryseobacterium sediminis TaxID=1679494 RepID=A0A5B2U9F8_9FLAO|nr:hypothetical protein [Chryseobacterium sediminis]KAA2222997.1 hypothetical protein FW780_01995 [Chryseobacterium sediminis]